MKRYDEYSKEELAELSEEQINTLVELEIAYAGILPAICPQPIPPFDPGIKPTHELYECCGLLFESQADAISLSGMSVSSKDYDYYSGGVQYQYATKRDYDSSVKKIFLYHKEDVDRVKAALKERKELEESYKAAQKEYDKFVKETSEIRSTVFTAWREALKFRSAVSEAKRVYEKYLTLAEGNEKIADQFFTDAYRTEPDIIKAVFPPEAK